jgi:CHAT domain-containing protein/Tfp pilus assembly protein PilF
MRRFVTHRALPGMVSAVFSTAAAILIGGCTERAARPVADLHEDRGRVELLRSMAAPGGNEQAIALAAQEHPDTLRLALARTFARLTAGDDEARAAEFATARRLADAHARAWADSFLVHEVARFERWSPEQRISRVAADSLRLAGIDVIGREGVTAAMALWREALERVSPVDTAGRAAALASVGAGFYRAGEHDSATAYLTRSLRLAGSIGDHRTLGTATGILASVSKDAGDLLRAATLYQEAASIRQRTGDWRGLAADHNNLGLISRALGDHDEARHAFERALDLNRREGHRRPSALNLTNLGDIASLRGEYARADSLYGEALAINRADGDIAETGFVLHDLGLLATRRGQYTRALELLAEALSTHEQSGALLDAVAVRHDLAAVHAATGNFQAALHTLDQARRDADALSDATELQASLALRRADLAVQLGAFAEADAAFALAESLYAAISDDAGAAEAQHGRALLLHLRGDHAGALRLLELAARTHAITGDRRATALGQLLIGQVRGESGDTASARQTLTAARETLRSVGDVVGEAVALDALGQLAARSGATLAAEQFYHEGLERIRGAAAVDVASQLHAHLAEALRSRGALETAAHHLQVAVAALEEAAAGLRLEERRVGYLSDKWKVYASLSLIEQERGRPPEAFAASELLRARQLRDLLARGRVTVQRDDSGREQDLRRRITELLAAIEAADPSAHTQREALLTGQPPNATLEALARAQAEYGELLLHLRESDPAYGQMVTGEIVSWKSVAARLQPDQVLLKYLVADSGSTVFVVTNDTIHALELDVDRAALASLVEFARRTMERPGSSPATPLWRPPLRRLYQQLIQPVEQRGLLEGKARLVIVPHGELHFVHFGALLGGQTGNSFLVERFEFSYAPSATVWVRLAQRKSARPTGGVIALAPRTTSLPASREEVLAIRRTYRDKATVLMGATATKGALLARARDHAILHVASYGILNKHNPLFSFVELAAAEGDDGRLEVHEVYGLELAGQLVVLSACQTALGSGTIGDVPPGDDWVGLVQAFLYAGADGVLASLWPVEDRATAQLMQHFYRSLGAGRSEATALAEAQRAMLRDRATVHPFYWAGFVLTGGSLRD